MSPVLGLIVREDVKSIALGDNLPLDPKKPIEQMFFSGLKSMAAGITCKA